MNFEPHFVEGASHQGRTWCTSLTGTSEIHTYVDIFSMWGVLISTVESYLSRFPLYKIGHEPRVLLKRLSLCTLPSCLAVLGCTGQFGKILGKGNSWKTLSQYGTDVPILGNATWKLIENLWSFFPGSFSTYFSHNCNAALISFQIGSRASKMEHFAWCKLLFVSSKPWRSSTLLPQEP